jgi:hypothetical protein
MKIPRRKFVKYAGAGSGALLTGINPLLMGNNKGFGIENKIMFFIIIILG